MTTSLLLVDAGRSACRVGVWDGHDRRLLGEGPGIEHVSRPGALDGLTDSLRAALAGQELPEGLRAASIGLTGVYGPSSRSAAIADAVIAAVAVPAVTVTGDLVTSYAGALGDQAGVVVAAGTGSIALAVAPDGTARRADGWGYLAGDAGSGFWIGQHAIDAALRAHDGRGGSQALLAAVRAQEGSPDALVARLHGSPNPAREVARFAPMVVSLADEGDPSCTSILEAAGTHLADTAAAAAFAAFPQDAATIEVSWSGGLFRAGAPLLRPFEARLRAILPAADLQAPDGDGLLGAARVGTLPEGSPLTGLVEHLEVVR